MDAIQTCEREHALRGQNTVSQMKLTDLIEDCLIRIFSLLKDNDLVNVAGVNKQFLYISRSVYSKNIKGTDVDILLAFDEEKNAKKAFTMTKNLLERFGDLITSTGFDYSCVKKKAMRQNVHELIIEHCRDTLEEANFLGLNDSLQFPKPFPKLKTLYFVDGSFHHSMSDIGTFFPNVEKISFDSISGFSSGFAWNHGFEPHHIPSLLSFNNGYECSHKTTKPDMGWYLGVTLLNHFIALNPQLRKLSTNLNSHKCYGPWYTQFVRKNVVQIPENARMNDHPMSFKITAKSCASDCDVFDHLIVPYERVESLELCLKNLTASEFITKCFNIKKLRLYIRFDSNLFNSSYFNEIASSLPLLEEFFLALETKDKYDAFAEYLFPNSQNEVNYEKGSIGTILPFINKCRQLEKIDFRYTFESRMSGPKKTEFTKKYMEDIQDFEKTIRREHPNWSSNNKEMDNFGSFGYIFELTK